MDATLLNSFYYFFSAVPQVLGGILALFGVFVLFKLQSLNLELDSAGKDFLHLSQYSKNKDAEKLKFELKIYAALTKCLSSKNFKLFKENLDLSTVNKLYQGEKLKSRENKFNNIYAVYENLKDQTIKLSGFTALIIVFCLAIIPFGKWIICVPVLLILIFITVIICVAIIFYKFYKILKESLT
jgi:hypothetical protein